MDDALFIHPKNFDLQTFHNYINDLHPSIKFTIEKSQQKSLPFLDILLDWNNNNAISFAIYRKPTHSPKYLHWYSTHKESIKIGVVSTLHLRALRICSTSTLPTEQNFIQETFKKLAYPNRIIHRGKQQAIKVFTTQNEQTGAPNPDNNTDNLLIVNANINLKINNTKTVSSYKNYKRIFKPQTNSQTRDFAIYSISCNTCNKKYIGETVDLKRRTYQHAYDLRTFNQSSPLVQHTLNQAHQINIKNPTKLSSIGNLKKRKLIESYVIRNTNNINRDRGSYTIDDTTNFYLKYSIAIQKLDQNLKQLIENLERHNQPNVNLDN